MIYDKYIIKLWRWKMEIPKNKEHWLKTELKNTRPAVYISLAVFLLSLIFTIVINCSTLVNGTYIGNVDGVKCSYEIDGNTFYYYAEKDGSATFDVGVYHRVPANTKINSSRTIIGDNKIYFSGIHGDGSRTVERNSSFSFTATISGRDCKFTSAWAIVAQVICAIGLIICTPISIAWCIHIGKIIKTRRED